MKRNLDCFVALSAVLFLISSASAQDLLGQVGRMAQVAAPAAGNLAYHRPVMQSSTDYGGDPRRANDGNTDGNYWIHSTSHTRGENQPWWQVDLEGVHYLRNIRIWNRTDCCGDRLANFFVFVSDTPFTSKNLDATRDQPGVWNFYHRGAAGRTTDVPVNRTGRYVRVQLSDANYLQLTEVEVFGAAGPAPGPPAGRMYTARPAAPPPAPTPSATANLALRRPVQQSSTDWGGDPRRAVDGNTDGNYGANSTSHTRNENQPWWQVDLGSLHPMENIRIWNRTDCCGERLANFFVFVSDAPFPSGNLDATRSQPGVWNFYHTGVARRTTDIRVNRTGRYVRVQLSGANYLQLTEVEVFGGAASGRAYTDARRPAPVSLDLTGRWRCNDGGSYYLRQLGDRLWWFGQSGDGGQSWSNVFHGRMEGAQVRGNWADVPHGRIMNSGEMVLQILAPNYLRATHRTGGFGGSEWTR